MAIFDPSKYEEEPRESVSFVAPEGDYELYFSELATKVNHWENGDEKVLSGKVVFMDGPRAGKYFFHEFKIFRNGNPENVEEADEKHKKQCVYFASFCRAIGVGPVDPEEDNDKLINKTFIGTVQVNEKNGKKTNRLLPWVFHKVGGDAPLAPKPSTSKPQSSGVSSGKPKDAVPFDASKYEDDIPF